MKLSWGFPLWGCLLIAGCVSTQPTVVDFSSTDSATPPDLAAPADLKKPADLKPPVDLTGLDLTVPPDLTTPPDLFGADLTPPPPPKLTGQPCMQDGDCKNGSRTENMARCLKSSKAGNGLPDFVWPNGYCSMTGCLTQNNSQAGYNEECPGVKNDMGVSLAYCSEVAESASTTVRRCYARCNSSAAECSAIRGSDTDYLCFTPGFCEPKAFAQCDPKVAGSCPPVTDGGATGTCANLGFLNNQLVTVTPDNTAGLCFTSCPVFDGTGCPSGYGCFAQPTTGEGFCFLRANTSSPPAGSNCNFDFTCKSGYGCLNGKCWKYCNTANAETQCAVGAPDAGVASGTCVKIGLPDMGTIDPDVVGICSKSN